MNKDGVDRRGFLECMAWAGTGVIWTVGGGMLSSKAFGQTPHDHMSLNTGFSFVQIMDRISQWGWGTEDGMKALSFMKRFGSVTVLNGHIHQTMQKLEVKFFTTPRTRPRFRNRNREQRHHPAR